MTKEQLREYQDIKKEIAQLEVEIQEFYETCIKSVVIDDIAASTNRKNGKMSDPTAHFADKAAKMHTRLLYKKYELACSLEKIEDCINCLKSKERVLMREYYINGLSWEQVAVKMNYNIRHVWRIHGEALEKIKHGSSCQVDL